MLLMSLLWELTGSTSTALVACKGREAEELRSRVSGQNPSIHYAQEAFLVLLKVPSFSSKTGL